MIFPAVLDSSILDDSDISPSYPVLGKTDQDESILSSRKREKIVKSALFIRNTLNPQPVLGWISNLLDQCPTSNSKSLVLRC